MPTIKYAQNDDCVVVSSVKNHSLGKHVSPDASLTIIDRASEGIFYDPLETLKKSLPVFFGKSWKSRRQKLLKLANIVLNRWEKSKSIHGLVSRRVFSQALLQFIKR